MTEIIDFQKRTKTILVEDVTNENGMEVVVDGNNIEDASEILVITNTEDGEITIHTNMDTRDLIYMLEAVKFDLFKRGNDEVEG